MWAWMFGIGVAMEVLGLVVTAIGIRDTWRANAREPFAGPAVAAIKRFGWWVNARLPRRLRRSHTIHATMGAAAAGAFAYGSATVSSRPLSPVLSPEAAIAELDAHIRRVDQRQQEAENAIRRRLEELASQDSALGRRLDQMDEQLAETARALRVEGLRGQAVGIGLVALGLTLQSMGQMGL